MAKEEEKKRKDADSANWLKKEFPILTIKNFSCIKDLTVDFRRLVVIIGEQATGKSITCKLYYFFTQVLQNVAASCLREELDADVFRRRLIREFGIVFPQSAWKQDAFTINWQYGVLRIQITHGSRNERVKLNLFKYKDRYLNALSKIKYFNVDGGKQDDFDVRWRYEMHVRRTVSEQFSDLNVDYIPAGRSFFSTIQDVVFSLLSNNVGIDYFLKEFGQKLEMLRHRVFRWTGEDHRRNEFDDLCQSIIHGKYLYDGKEQWIITDRDRKIRLADASSGQQEALPLLMVLSQLEMVARRRLGLNRILIEEPEAHLYPTAQQSIVDTIGRILQKGTSLGCIITTHSPFVLCCINNVLKRQVGLQGAVSAYHLHDGIGDVIYDDELGMINASRFDDASFAIANV